MKRLSRILIFSLAGLALGFLPAAAQHRDGHRLRDRIQAWERDMEEFRARSDQRRHLRYLADSLAGVQAYAAIQNQDFVLEAESVSFRTGPVVFVNSATNFISIKGNRAVVQIAPNAFPAGPNGLGGVTVEGVVSARELRRSRSGKVAFSFNVVGIGINAQVEIYLNADSNRATATVYPNFNSNTVWMTGQVVPYENSRVVEGNSL